MASSINGTGRWKFVKPGLFSGGPPTKLHGWLRLRPHAEKRAISLAFGVPAHPDRAAGLRFVGYSVNAPPFAVALSVIAAGMIANWLLHDATALLSYKLVVIGLAVFVAGLVVAPLLAFSGKLLAAWDRGVLDYGALANRVGREFERHWIEDRGDFAANPLHGQLSSAAARMGTQSSNVYGMRFIPVDSRSVILLVVMTLLPFLPVVLMVLPLDVVVKDLAKFLI